MRIGLLTYHWVANYGANLQALSTYCYLDNNGYNPIIINWVPNDALADYQNSSSEEQLNAHHKFIKTRCRLTRQFSEQSEISAILNEEGITHVLVGSDALFNIIRPHFHLKLCHIVALHLIIFFLIYIGERGLKRFHMLAFQFQAKIVDILNFYSGETKSEGCLNNTQKLQLGIIGLNHLFPILQEEKSNQR